jgi:NAD(P)-dependent dehydrogenase (short-subunit alcohol dehydrogenase family)
MFSNHTTRKIFLGGVGMSVTAFASQTALAQASPKSAAKETAAQNPLDLYPRPPFPEQSQPWPGLSSKMTPVPDHGEHSYRGSNRLAGRKALVTGGDSGMGRAAAIAFAREGADVAIGYLPAEESDAQEVLALIKDSGRKGVALPGDIRSEAFCRQLVDDAVSRLGGIDILVNNAARQHSHNTIADLSTEDFDWTFKTNIYAMFWITKAALPHMGPGSSIVNTASVQAYEPSPNLLDYAPTKAAIVRSQSRFQSKGFASMPSPPGLCGRPFRSAAGSRRNRSQRSAPRPRTAAPDSRRSSRPFMSLWLLARQVIPRGKCLAPPPAAAVLRRVPIAQAQLRSWFG